MKFLTFLLVFITSIRNTPVFFDGVEKTYLLENKFWGPDNKQDKTDKGLLNRIDLRIVGGLRRWYNLCHYPDTNYYLSYTKQFYLIQEKDFMYNFNHFISSPEEDKGLIEVSYLFTDKLIENSKRENFYMHDQKQRYLTYLAKDSSTERNNKISMRCDGIDIRNSHIKHLILKICSLKLQKFNQYVHKVQGNRPEDGLTWLKMDAKYKIYYFKDYYSCFENIKKFINDLYYLNFVGGNYQESLSNHPRTSKGVTRVEISNFIRRLRTGIEERIKKLKSDKQSESEYENAVKKILDKCFSSLVKIFETNNILLPTGGKYNFQFYYEKLQEIVYNIIVSSLEDYFDEEFVGLPKDLTDLEHDLNREIHSLSLEAFYDLFKIEYIFKHFANVYGKNFRTQEDYVCLDKMLCDYLNTFLYIISLVYTEDPVCYEPPVFVNDYDYKLVSCIEVDEECLFPSNILALDDNGVEIRLNEGVHYFVKGSKRYYPYDVIKRMNIYEFYFESYGTSFSKSLRVFDFLNQ